MTHENIQALLAERGRLAREYNKATAPLDGKLERLRRAAKALVRQGSTITGCPHPWCHGIREIKIGADVCVALIEESHDGNDYIIRRLRFPTRWLSMPVEDWKKELLELHLAHKARKERERESVVMRTVRNQRENELAQLRRLAAKYPDAIGGTT